MAPRRHLVDGINRQPTEEELAFIQGRLRKPTTDQPQDDAAFTPQIEYRGEGTEPAVAAVQSLSSPTIARAPISTRIRGDIAAALKRASLQRQLDKVEPNAISDILEIALEPWLKSHGYLP